ncbi:unnamed protein product [Urochloa humidicola]
MRILHLVRLPNSRFCTRNSKEKHCNNQRKVGSFKVPSFNTLLLPKQHVKRRKDMLDLSSLGMLDLVEL